MESLEEVRGRVVDRISEIRSALVGLAFVAPNAVMYVVMQIAAEDGWLAIRLHLLKLELLDRAGYWFSSHVAYLRINGRAARGGAGGAAALVGFVFALFLGIQFAASIFPTAFGSIFGANTSAWTAGTVGLWFLIPLVGVAVFLWVIVSVGLGH